MNDTPDPLEAELAALRPHDGSPRLRQRIADLRAQSQPARAPSPWRAAALAATVLLALNLVLALGNARNSIRSNNRDTGDLEAITARIRQHDPELPATEVRQQALLVLASTYVTPRPDAAKCLNRFPFAKEDVQWDMR